MSLRIPLLPEPLRWLPVLAVAGLICYWSLVTTPPDTLPLETAFTASTGEPTASGLGVGSAWVPQSYVRHAVAYATLALSLVYALLDRNISLSHKVVLAFAVATGYGAAMEVGQVFLPDRVASPADVVVNALGATAALGWYGLERRVTFVPLGEFSRGIGRRP